VCTDESTATNASLYCEHLSVACLVNNAFSDGCHGQGEVLRNRLQMPIPEWNPFPLVRLMMVGHVLLHLKRFGPASLAAESAAMTPTGDLPSIGSP
jgi:hypothetical protein